jgi:MraZ protein
VFRIGGFKKNKSGYSFVGLFLSTFINRIDKKGRVSVPASFRAALGDAQSVVLYPSYKNNAIEGVSVDTMSELAGRMDQNFDMFSDDHDEMATVLFGESIQLSFDENGRFSLPQQFIEFAGIDGEMAFVGMGNKFQIWNPADLDARKNTARDAVQSKKMTLPKGNAND